MPRATFAVAVRFRIRPEHASDFLEVVKRQAANSLSREPDCHQFDVCVHDDAPEEIFLYETYSDVDAFAAHRETKHFAEFSETVATWVANKEVATWTIAELE